MSTPLHCLKTSSLSQQQFQILKEYKKLRPDAESPEYSMEGLTYMQLPTFVPSELKQQYSVCVPLSRFTFYEMFTMVIVEYLWKDGGRKFKGKIDKLKELVYSKSFLTGSIYTKGLLVQGFHKLQKTSPQLPIGQCLLNCDSISAFTQCWKQLVNWICSQNSMPPISENEIDSSIFQLFAEFFQVHFHVYWKEKGKNMWKEQFNYDGPNRTNKIDTLSLIVDPENQIWVSQRSVRMGDSGSLDASKNNSGEGFWGFIILTDSPRDETTCREFRNDCSKAEMSNGEEISRISQIQESYGETEEIKIFLEQKQSRVAAQSTTKKMPKFRKDLINPQTCIETINATMNKAESLIEQMKVYSNYLTKIKLPQFQALKSF